MARFSNEAAVKDAINDVLRPSSKSGWVLVGYENDQTLVLQNKGNGSIDDVSAFLQENQVQYVLTRIPTSHLKENADTTRDVFIAYTGPRVSRIAAAKKATNAHIVQSVLAPSHAQLTCSNKDKLSLDEVIDKSAPLSGSHHIE